MPSFTRGIWQAVGTNTYYSQVWRNGSGQDVGQIRGNSGSLAHAFDPWVGGAFDTNLEELGIICPGGDQDGSSNEVIVFSMADLAWHRRIDPTVGLIPPNTWYGPNTTSYTFGPFPGGGTVPQYFDDSSNASPWNSGVPWRSAVNTYPDHSVPVTDIYTGLTNQKLYPGGRHTYDAICFMGPPINKYFLWGGASGQLGTTIPMEWDPTTLKYEFLTSEMSSIYTTNVSGIVPAYLFMIAPNFCWDSDRNRVIGYPGDRLIAYNPSAARGSRFSVIGTTEGGNPGGINYTSMFYDARRKRVIRFGYATAVNPGFAYWDFSSSATVSVPAVYPTLTGAITQTLAGSFTFDAPGALYDPVGDQYVFYSGLDPNALYFMDPDTFASERIEYTGGSNATVPGTFSNQYTSAGRGHWKRFFYSPTYDVFGIAPDAQAPVYIFAPIRNTPTLAFSDITRGKRTGNPDTSKGQTANANGAIVSVYGLNLGSQQDTSTISIGGVNATTIYYWGAAEPPHCQSDLVNGFHNLQMVVFQIPSTCPLGSQNIVVTVNGQASAGLSFTVDTTGSILLSDSFASPQAAVSAMGNGDVLYIKNATVAFLDHTALSPSVSTAIVGFPGATVNLGNNSSDPFTSGLSGFNQNRVYANLRLTGSAFSGAYSMNLGDGSRAVGCYYTAPNGNGSSGTLGVFGSNTAVLGCEFFHCGTGPPADDQYHVIYRFGRRSQPTQFVESGYRAAYNYIHDCAASRAFNCFNGENPEFHNNPIADHEIDHNVVVNQQWAAVGLLDGVVGTNVVHDNLFINCGLSTGSSTGNASGIQLNAGYQPDWPGATNPITLNFYNNTILNAGESSITTTKGAFYVASATRYSLLLHNNIVFQPNGVPYVTYAQVTDILTADATKRSNNLWFGAGATPGLDSSAINANPQLRSITAPYDLHLLNISQAINNGANLSLPTAHDLDGVSRPATGNWDIGAYQFAAGGFTPTPPSATIAISYDGKLRDRVGQGNTALAPDGALDGTFTVQVLAPGGKTVQYVRVDMHDTNGGSIGIWDTDSSNVYFVAAVATGLDAVYLNNASTMAVNFAIDDGSSFRVFISDFNNIEFLDANVATITVQFSDGTSASQSVTIGAEPPPPDPGGGGPASPSTQFNFQTMFMYGQGA